MQTATCSVCGKDRIIGSMTDGVCVLCREKEGEAPRSSAVGRSTHVSGKWTPESPDHPRSSAGAIDTVNKANTYASVITGVLWAIVILVALVGDTLPSHFMIVGLFMLLVTWLIWAVTRVYVGIAQDIRSSADDLRAMRKKMEQE